MDAVAPPLGHVYVESARGERLLDAHPSPGQPLALRLPEERPLFVRKQDNTAELVVSEREPVTLAWQVPPASEIARKGALHLAFERLFASPFGPPAVTAFESRPPDLELRQIEPPAATATATLPNPRVATARRVAGWTAVAAGAAGIVFSALALDRYAAERTPRKGSSTI